MGFQEVWLNRDMGYKGVNCIWPPLTNWPHVQPCVVATYHHHFTNFTNVYMPCLVQGSLRSLCPCSTGTPALAIASTSAIFLPSLVSLIGYILPFHHVLPFSTTTTLFILECTSVASATKAQGISVSWLMLGMALPLPQCPSGFYNFICSYFVPFHTYYPP